MECDFPGLAQPLNLFMKALPMTPYQASINSVNKAQKAYDAADSDDTLLALFAAKKAHREAFTTLYRVNGEWV